MPVPIRDRYRQMFIWLVPFSGIGATMLFWLGDVRNRPGINPAKSAGETIDADPASAIPE